MAYSTGRRQCVTDISCKQAAVFSCQGCSKVFCSNHVLDHRRKLGEEMNEIIGEHDRLKSVFTQHTSNPNLHPLIKQIDEWEKESIEKIQQKAKELREQLIQPTAVYVKELSKRLEPLSEQLNKGRELDDFIEADLRLWKHNLDLIKSDLISPLKFTINQDDKIPLVRNTSIIFKTINEQFERVFDDKVRITENGEVVTHDGPMGYKEIRGKNQYSSGCHKIRLRVECAFNINLCLGINSKATALESTSYSSKSSYVWTSYNRVYLDGSQQSNTPSPCIEMHKNDIIILIFDCDNRKIAMINERTNVKHELTVNVDNCPFPWQLHVNMYYAKECVRILPS